MNLLAISAPGGAEFLLLILPIVFVVVVALLLRKVYLWYTGMIELLTENLKQTKLLEEIRDEMKKR